MEDLESLIQSLQTLNTNRVKAIKVKKMTKEEKRYGLLDPGATHNVRKIKKEEAKVERCGNVSHFRTCSYVLSVDEHPIKTGDVTLK